MSTVICRHIYINGARCGSPALGGRTLCYHHMKVADCHRSVNASSDIETILHPVPIEHRERVMREPLLAAYYGVKTGPLLLDLPPLEDGESIQIALSMIVAAMAQNSIDSRRAGGIIYALQVASNNARMLTNNKPSRSQMVRETVLDEDGRQLAPDVDPESELALQELVKNPENKEDNEAGGKSHHDLDEEERL